MHYRAVSNTDKLVFIKAETLKEARRVARRVIESWGDIHDYLWGIHAVEDPFEALYDAEHDEWLCYEDEVEYLIYDRSMV